MIQLTDYLYSGDTVLRILQRYSNDLRENANETGNELDSTHADFLDQVGQMLEHNEFLTSQSRRFVEFYRYLGEHYPYLAFTLHGRIKSLIRTEEKFNGYIVQDIYNSYIRNGTYPSSEELQNCVRRFRDLIAYRIVISIPACHLKEGENREKAEEKILYEIANTLPNFMKQYSFVPQPQPKAEQQQASPMMDEHVRRYFKDYIVTPKDSGYRSLHIVFYDEIARSYTEVQLRTKQMDDYAEIGLANHAVYEKQQEYERSRRSAIPEGECRNFDEAYERIRSLQQLDLTRLDVNMFSAYDQYRINDGCGLYYGRLILPYEHLSRFQNNKV